MKFHRLVGALALVLFVSCIVGIARADTVSITWVNPPKNTDGSTIPDIGAGSLQSWRFEYGTCSAPNVFGTKVGEFPRTRAVGGPALTTTTNNFDPGTTCLRGYVTNTYGVESDVSNVIAKTVTAPKPGPIQLASIDTLAFSVLRENVNLQVGTLPLGTECTDHGYGDGYFRIANPGVVRYFPHQRKRSVIAAQCGPTA